MHRRNVIAVVFGIISGIILILTNTMGGIGFLAYVPGIVAAFGLPQFLSQLLNIFLSVLSVFALLGGWTVLIGSLLVVLGRRRVGVWLMSVGTGMSLINLIWNLAQVFLGWLPFSVLVTRYQVVAWAGAILSVIAQETVQIREPEPPSETPPIEELREDMS